MNKNFDIEKFMSLKDYANETRVNRRKGTGGTNEFFTPYSLVKKMADKITPSLWNDPTKTYLEPSFGDGQFIIYIIYNRIMHGQHWYFALSNTYGVELMIDNVKSTHDRIINMLHLMDIDFDETTARNIMKNNLVCSDFFRWHFDEWRPMTDEEYYKTEHGKKELAKMKKNKKAL